MQCDTINRKLNIKQQVPFIVCRVAEPSGALERVKGKRVQIPHDLVTVIREPAARVLLAPATEALLWEGGGGRRSFSQETCLLLVQERTAPDHEELVVPKSLWIMGLFVLPFRKQKGLFLFAENALSEPCSGGCKLFCTNKKERNSS